MALRKAHGNGSDALVRVEVLPADELRPLNADDTRDGLALDKARGRPFERGNRASAGRKPALAAAAGIPLDSKDPRYKTALRHARAYRNRRVRELTIQHGGELSAGVCGLITSASIDMAASRYLSLLATETLDPATMKMASQLAAAARQTELTALDIASREAAARPKRIVDYLE